MMKLQKVFCLSVLLLVVFGVVLPERADAIPAFSRKYKTACMTCHAPFPRLNAVGEAYRLNGYKFSDTEELYVKDEPVSMGAELYKQVFPDSVWPSDIPHLPPVSLRVTGDVVGDTGRYKKDSKVDFEFQDEVAILSAGTFGDKVSFFVEIGFEEDEAEAEAWLMYQSLFGSALGTNHLNIKAGNLGMQEISLPNTRGHNRITAQDYLYMDELDLTAEPGFEVNGFGKRWRYALGVVEADDSNDEKDFYGTLSFKLFGLGYDGSGGTAEKGGPSTPPTGYWRDDSVQFGIFGYRTYVSEDAKAFDRIGGDIRLNYKDFSLAGGFIRGMDDETDIDKNIGFGEVEYWVFPWWVAYTRYEDLFAENADDEDIRRFIVGSSFLLLANVKFNLEGRLHLKNEPARFLEEEEISDDRFTLRVDWSF